MIHYFFFFSLLFDENLIPCTLLSPLPPFTLPLKTGFFGYLTFGGDILLNSKTGSDILTMYSPTEAIIIGHICVTFIATFAFPMLHFVARLVVYMNLSLSLSMSFYPFIYLFSFSLPVSPFLISSKKSLTPPTAWLMTTKHIILLLLYIFLFVWGSRWWCLQLKWC